MASSSSDSFDVLDDRSNSNSNQNEPDVFVEKIMKYFLRHNLTLVALEDLMDLLNENREEWDKFPTSKKQIMKLFRKHRNIFEVFHLIRCNKCKFICKVIAESSKNKCEKCGNYLKKTETNFFVYIPIKQQIIRSIKENIEFVTEKKFVEDSYTDAHDGSILKDVLKQYQDTDVNILSLTINLDGANKFKSNMMSVWPMQLIQNYLPPTIRFSPNNIIVTGLHYGKKPNCYDFMMPLITDINELNDENIIVNFAGVDYKFKPVITHCSVDLPAKSMLQETKQHGSYDGCTYCHISGEAIVTESLNDESQEDEENKKTKKKGKKKCVTPMKFVRYVEDGVRYKLREEKEMLATMLSVAESKTGDAVDGIKDVSCMVGIKHFNIVWSFAIDYMHAVLLGVMKRILNFLCNPKFHSKPFYITPSKRKELSRRICAIRPIANVTRKPQSLDQRKNFKASEYRSMFLYYLPVCLPGSIANNYIKHIRILAAAVYTLLKTKISNQEVDEAEEKLETFVKQHQDLFGKENMVMFVHLIKHLAESVRQLGPLWCNSAFAFERNNGCLLRLANGTTDVLHQMSSKYTLNKSFRKEINSKADKEIFQGKSVKMQEKSLKVVSMDGSKTLDFSDVPLDVFKRIKLNNVIFTSLLYTRAKKTVDYFIGLRDETIGMARFYFEHNNSIFVVIEKYEEIEYIHHIAKVQKTSVLVMAPIDEINEKYIYMKVGINHYIVSPPNPYENE